MDEVLLGRPLLKKLGFNLDAHLREIQKTSKDIDMSTIENALWNQQPARVDIPIGPASYKVLSYYELEDDPIPPLQSGSANIGEDDDDQVVREFGKALNEAKENGLSGEGYRRVQGLLFRFKDMFRINLGSDPPGKVPPMEVRLKPDAHPWRAKQRKYAPKQQAFIESTVKKLVEVGAIWKNPAARWASPALAEPKPGTEEFRFTVDLRGPNQQTVHVASAMSDMENLLQ